MRKGEFQSVGDALARDSEARRRRRRFCEVPGRVRLPAPGPGPAPRSLCSCFGTNVGHLAEIFFAQRGCRPGSEVRVFRSPRASGIIPTRGAGPSQPGAESSPRLGARVSPGVAPGSPRQRFCTAAPNPSSARRARPGARDL